MKLHAGLGLCVFFALCCSSANTANVLAYFTSFSKSHLIIHMAVAKTLMDRGHNVTVVTILPLSEKNPKYRHIKLDVEPPDLDLIMDSVKKPKNMFSKFFERVNFIASMLRNFNESLNQPEVEKLKREESFDLVIVGFFLNEFTIGLAAHFKCPLVMCFSQAGSKIANDWVGNPAEPFYVPSIFASLTQPMGFVERVKNVLVHGVENFLAFINKISQKSYYESNFPPDKYPTFEEMKRNISLVLLCTHFSQGVIRPNVPAVIDVGGIQIKPKPDPLPEDIGKFLDSASDHGALYFSLGSNAKSSGLRPEVISMVYNVLSSLKTKVLWKWEKSGKPGNATNILFKKWLPQDDILAHPNVKLFITHGGMGSIVESEYHGVPVIGMPLFGDQFANMNTAEKSGYGLTVNQAYMTEESFRNSILEVLENPKYRNAMKQFSSLYRDRPMSPQDTAGFWLEYVIRHKGAKHMQSPAVHMNTIEYFGLDVIALFIGILYIVSKLTFLIIKFLFRKVCRISCKDGKSKKLNKIKED